MWTLFLIGVAVGAFLTLATILPNYVLTSKQAAEESAITNSAMRSRLHVLTAENAKLRVALAAGEMTEEGKKVAAMAMAALDAVMEAEEEAIQKREPSLVCLAEAGHDR